MKARFFWLSFVALFMLNAGVFEVSAQTVFKGILLRSKEKVEFSRSEWVTEKGPKKDYYGDEDSTVSDSVGGDSVVVEVLREVKKNGYQEYSLGVRMEFSVEAYPYRNNRYLQEDIVKFVTKENPYSDTLVKVMQGYMRGAKTLDDMFKRLKKVKGYNKPVVYDDDVSFTAAVNADKKEEINKSVQGSPVKITLENGILSMREGYKYNSETLGLYDVETGKRIEPSDLLTTLRWVNEHSKDTVTITSVSRIDAEDISFRYKESSYGSEFLRKDSPFLTPYAKSLMERDKGYKLITHVNEYGDQIQSIKFEKINGEHAFKEVHLPLQLNGCKNTQKIRNRMLDVMFGRSDGDLEELITEGVKKWVSRYGRGSQMLLKVGDGLVSFGFENLSAYANDRNTFIVFDKTTGEEIAVKDLIKDQKGFMDYVNSFNMYFAGFLFDSTNVERGPKVGENLRSYLKHSGGYLAPFNGWKEFPISWWFAFSNMDGFVSVEFNTSSSRIFLNYSDIRAFIDPKYHEVLDRAVKSIGE